VKALEEQLGVQLFHRTTRKVSLNATGEAYFQRSICLLEDMEDMDASVQAQHGSPKGKIRISAPTAFGEMHLVSALAKFQQQHPDVTFDVDLSNRKVSMVEEGFDLALRLGQLEDSTMVSRQLTSMRVCVFSSLGYLKQHESLDHPRQLASHNCFINTHFRFGRHWPFLINGEEQKIEVSGNFQANAPRSVCEMVLKDLGIGMAPMYIIYPYLKNHKITILFEDYEAHTFGLYALYPHRKHLSTRVRVLVDFLAEHFAPFCQD
jgi:DNA-binding transcriptional LysR family regulator